jgi:hypothetical protein
MITGLVGAFAPWLVGLQVRRLGDAAHEAHSYFALYGGIGCLGMLAIAGVPCLHAIRKREHINEDGSSEFP